jgi:hypothetical protein
MVEFLHHTPHEGMVRAPEPRGSVIARVAGHLVCVMPLPPSSR